MRFSPQASHFCRSSTTKRLPMHNSCNWMESLPEQFQTALKYVSIPPCRCLQLKQFQSSNCATTRASQPVRWRPCPRKTPGSCSRLTFNSGGGDEQPTRARWEQDVHVVVGSANRRECKRWQEPNKTFGHKVRHHDITLELKATFDPMVANVSEYITTDIACTKAGRVRLSPRDINHIQRAPYQPKQQCQT